MNFVVKVVLLLTYVTMTIQHEAYPPGIPPPNMQAHGHQQQHQQNLQFQQAQHGQGQQQFHGQGQQQFQGQGQQQFQGHQNTQQFQQQQPPQHQQQQQQFQQQQHHQQQQQQQHGGGHHHPGGHQGFGQNQMVHDADHIKEHLKEVVDKPKEEMSEEELEFHYFKLHDYDSNNRLDGTEIVKAITHFHEYISEPIEEVREEGEQHEASPDAQQQKKVFSDEELVNIVDLVLKEDDLNLDGYIEYAEFVTAQRRARANEQKDGDKK